MVVQGGRGPSVSRKPPWAALTAPCRCGCCTGCQCDAAIPNLLPEHDQTPVQDLPVLFVCTTCPTCTEYICSQPCLRSPSQGKMVALYPGSSSGTCTAKASCSSGSPDGAAAFQRLKSPPPHPNPRPQKQERIWSWALSITGNPNPAQEPSIFEAAWTVVRTVAAEVHHHNGSSPYRFSELPEGGYGAPVGYTGGPPGLCNLWTSS